MRTKEEVYDQEISPLMAQIIKICKKHKIAMLASYFIPSEDDEGLQCTTALLDATWEPPQSYVQAIDLIHGRRRSPLMITTRDADGNITRMDAVL